MEAARCFLSCMPVGSITFQSSSNLIFHLKGILYPGNSRKLQAFAVGLVDLNRHRLLCIDLLHDYVLARPRIHDAAGNVASRLHFKEIYFFGIFRCRDQKAPACLKVSEGNLGFWFNRREKVNPAAAMSYSGSRR
mgnify:CR=1 FL=1